MLRQQDLITRVRERCAADPRLDAALMYGSIAQGVGDEYSDIEFWLFFSETSETETPETETLDPAEWCRRIGPTLAVTVNEFGSHVVFFEGLIRGEFHFATTADLPVVAGWPSLGARTDDIIVLDRRGALRPLLESLPRHVRPVETPAEIAELCLRFANWIVLAMHVTRRGEVLRAQDALGHARRHLLWMARLATGATVTWLTPSRRAETELPPGVIAQVHATLGADPHEALRAMWRTGRELWQELSTRHDFAAPAALWAQLDQRLA
jgi:lincosamide nucleotidyltransferase